VLLNFIYKRFILEALLRKSIKTTTFKKTLLLKNPVLAPFRSENFLADTSIAIPLSNQNLGFFYFFF